MKILLRHLNFSVQSRWKYTLLGLAIFPLIPLFGAVSMGWAILGTLMQQYRAVVSRPLNRGFMLLSVWLILTASFAYNKTEAFIGLFNFIPYFLVFASWSVLIQTIAQLRQLSWLLVITSVPVIVVGLGQLLLGWATPPQGWIGFLGWAIAPGGEPPGRMSSIFMYANSLAGYLIIVFILSLGLWLEQWRSMIRGTGEIRETRETRKEILPFLPPLPFLFLTLAILLNLVALILTNSRNAWAIAIFVCLVYALYQGWRILVATVTGVAAGDAAVLLLQHLLLCCSVSLFLVSFGRG